MKPQEYIRNSIKKALELSDFDTSDSRFLNLERPKQDGFGDISSPVAMSLAKIAKDAPRRIAEKIVQNLEMDSFYIEKVEIAGPGFINFYLSKQCLQKAVLDIIEEGETFGFSNTGGNHKVQFEFVSANPTGPLNVVSARAAAIGDVVTRLHKAAGYESQSEFYVNDAGRQIRLLGASLNARYMTELGHEEPIPEDGYHGEYLRDLALEVIDTHKDRYLHVEADERKEQFSQLALEYMLKRHQKSLEQYGVVYDNWFRESSIRSENAQDVILEKFKQNDLTYERDGALWFQTCNYGDEKDRVLITSEGEPTYFLIDIAYHQTKYDRGFETIHDFWGPDHHGYIDRMKAAMVALGHAKESFQVSIIQQVNLLRGGQIVKMSKRAGEIIEMDELLDEVGVDAARYFFVDRKMSQPLDFDIDLAKKQSDENPVYYLQYAHARICNIFRYAEKNGVTVPDRGKTDFLENALELAVIKKMMEYPEIISKSAQFLEPHRVTNYLHELATVFHRFYHENRVVTEDQELTIARLMLAKAAKQVLANGLELLGISAPENM